MSKLSHIGCFVTSIELYLKKNKNAIILKKKIFSKKINCHLILIRINGIPIELIQPKKNSKLYKSKLFNNIDHVAFYTSSLDKKISKFINSGAKIIISKTYSPLFKEYFMMVLLNGILIEFVEKN